MSSDARGDSWRVTWVTKGVLLVGLAASLCAASAAHAIDEAQFAALDRAATKMEKAAATGVSRRRFGALALEFAAALLGAEKNVRDDEDRELLSLYAGAGLAYGDSLTLWREKDDRRTPHVPASLPGVAALVSRYAIPVEDASGAGTVDCDSAIPFMWATARKELADARSVASRRRTLAEAEHQKQLIEQVEQEFERGERRPERPRPFEAGAGNWTCPSGYVIRGGRCLSDEEVSRLPKVEIGR